MKPDAPTEQDYINDMQRRFAYNGFIAPPLSVWELQLMYAADVHEDIAYSVGCDVACSMLYPMEYES